MDRYLSTALYGTKVSVELETKAEVLDTNVDGLTTETLKTEVSTNIDADQKNKNLADGKKRKNQKNQKKAEEQVVEKTFTQAPLSRLIWII